MYYNASLLNYTHNRIVGFCFSIKHIKLSLLYALTSRDVYTANAYSFPLRVITGVVISAWTVREVVLITKTIVPEWIDRSDISIDLINILNDCNVCNKKKKKIIS